MSPPDSPLDDDSSDRETVRRPEGWQPPAAPPSTRVGPYELLEEIGRGGMGRVYRARHVQLGTTCAVKVLSGSSVLSPESVARFRREASAVARMGRHPNIVAVHDLGGEGDSLYYAMELVEGESLRRRLRERTPSPQETSLLIEKVARGLHFAHGHGLVHRDVKPENILLRRDGEPLVVDFGLARDVRSEERISVTGEILGTPNYMAPEQVRGDVSATDARTDVYALGAVLYEMLAAVPAHPGGHLRAVQDHILAGEVVPPTRLRPSVPSDLETICLKCLELEPARRYASAEALADDLARWRAGDPIEARPVSRVYRFRRWAATRRFRIAVAAALAVAAIALFAAERASRRATERDRAARDADLLRQVQVAVAEALGRQRVGDPARLREVARQGMALARARLEEDPASATGWLVQGWMLRLEGSPAEAEEALGRALDRAPSDAMVLYQRALARTEAYQAVREDALRRLTAGGEGDADVSEAVLERIEPRLAVLRQGAASDLDAVQARAHDGGLSPLTRAMVSCARGLLALSQGRPEEAEPLLRRAVEEDRFLDDAWDGLILLAETRWTTSERGLEELLEAYERALEVNQGRWRPRAGLATTRFWEGYARWEEGRLDRAEELWESGLAEADAAIRLGADRPEPLVVRATLLVRIGQAHEERGQDGRAEIQASIDCASGALALSPSFADALQVRGHAWTDLAEARTARNGDPTEYLAKALEDFDAILALAPRHVSALNSRGIVWLRRGRTEEARGEDPSSSLARAEEDFTAARDAAPDFVSPLVNRGLVEVARASSAARRGGDAETHYGKARETLEAALAQDPKNANARSHLAHVFLQIGLLEKGQGKDALPSYRSSIGLYGEVLQANPERKDAWMGRGTALLALEEVDAARGVDTLETLRSAISDFERALARDPQDLSALYSRGTACGRAAELEKGRGGDPREDLRKAIEGLDAMIAALAPADSFARRGYLRCEMAREEEARGGDPRPWIRGSVEDYREFAALVPKDPGAHYTLACVLSRASLSEEGEERRRLRDEAFEHLKETARLGATRTSVIEQEEDLAPLRSDPRWNEVWGDQ